MAHTNLILTSSKGKTAHVTHTNVIGINEVASFFASNGWAITDDELDVIFDLEPEQLITFRFRNQIDWIRVERSTDVYKQEFQNKEATQRGSCKW